MQVLSILAVAGLAVAQMDPTTLATVTVSDMPKASSMPEVPDKLPTLSSASNSGSGCGSSDSVIPANANLNGTIFELSDMDMATGGGLSDRTKNCQIHLNLKDVPAGWQYATSEILLSDMEYSLEEGALIDVWFTVFFSQDATQTVTTIYEFGVNGIESLVLTIPEANLVWSPCGSTGILNMNTRFRIEDSGVVDRQEGEATTFGTSPLSEQFGYTWRRCGDAAEDEQDVLTETMTDPPAPTETEDEEECEAEEPEVTGATDEEEEECEAEEPEATGEAEEEEEECEAEEPEEEEEEEECEAEEPEEEEEEEECEAEEPEEEEEEECEAEEPEEEEEEECEAEEPEATGEAEEEEEECEAEEPEVTGEAEEEEEECEAEEPEATATSTDAPEETEDAEECEPEDPEVTGEPEEEEEEECEAEEPEAEEPEATTDDTPAATSTAEAEEETEEP